MGLILVPSEITRKTLMENTYSDKVPSDQERWELQKKIEEMDEIQQGCKRLIRELDDLEEAIYWQNRHSKTLNAELINTYQSDSKLQRLLIEKEDVMKQRAVLDREFFDEARVVLSKKIVDTERERENLVGEFNIRY